jgi:hypothetical protein
MTEQISTLLEEIGLETKHKDQIVTPSMMSETVVPAMDAVPTDNTQSAAPNSLILNASVPPNDMVRNETRVELEDPDNTDVSEVARKLLESVEHEQGDKWKNSRFLALMRDFRDGRKNIVDNDIYEVRLNPDQEHCGPLKQSAMSRHTSMVSPS